MKTRAQVIASHCVITRIPVEIITQIFELIPSDLRAVSGTCRYLRAISNPLIYQKMSVVPTKRASFAPLEALGGQGRKERAALLRYLYICETGDPDIRPPTSKVTSYRSVIHASLSFLANLTTISLPYPFLTTTLFRAIYDHPSITTLEIAGEARAYLHPNHLDLSSRLPLPPRPLLLTVPSIDCERGYSGPLFAKSLSTFLSFHSVALPWISIGITFARPLGFPLALDYPLFPHLTKLSVLALPSAFEITVDFLEVVIQTQTSLRTINLRFSDVVHGFACDDTALACFIKGEAYRPLPSFGDAMEGVRLRYVETKYTRADPEEDFIEESVELSFVAKTNLTPQQGRELADQARNADTVAFLGEDLTWSDWTSTVTSFQGEFRYLRSVFFGFSLVPIPTVTTTLACSSSCYKKLASSHPPLHAGSELVGGYLVVWKLTYDLTIARLEKLAPVFDTAGGKVFWDLSGKDKEALVAEVDGSVTDAGDWSTWTDEVKLSTEEKVKLCRCFGCGELKDGEDPLSALMACGGEEVRAALVVGGFDLDAFDSRPASLPFKADSFETFLRANSETDDHKLEDST